MDLAQVFVMQMEQGILLHSFPAFPLQISQHILIILNSLCQLAKEFLRKRPKNVSHFYDEVNRESRRIIASF